MRPRFIIFFLIFPVFGFAQFPEVQDQQDRELSGKHIKTINTFLYDYQDNEVDTTHESQIIYNTEERIIEIRTYSSFPDNYHCREYTYNQDSTNNWVTVKSFWVNPPTFMSYNYNPPPKKKIQISNTKGQIVLIKEYIVESESKKKHTIKKTFSYGENGLLDQVSVYIDKKLFGIYKLFYEFYPI